MAQPVPPELDRLMALNASYGVLVCRQCSYAQAPTALPRHLSRTHQVPAAVRALVDQYVEAFVQSSPSYDHATVHLPEDGSAPQPVIAVVRGFRCQACPFKSQSRDMMRKHANKAHDQKRRPDDEIFDAVRLQSWFGGKRERYWVVDENQTGMCVNPRFNPRVT